MLKDGLHQHRHSAPGICSLFSLSFSSLPHGLACASQLKVHLQPCASVCSIVGGSSPIFVCDAHLDNDRVSVYPAKIVPSFRGPCNSCAFETQKTRGFYISLSLFLPYPPSLPIFPPACVYVCVCVCLGVKRVTFLGCPCEFLSAKFRPLRCHRRIAIIYLLLERYAEPRGGELSKLSKIGQKKMNASGDLLLKYLLPLPLLTHTRCTSAQVVNLSF